MTPITANVTRTVPCWLTGLADWGLADWGLAYSGWLTGLLLARRSRSRAYR
jgi:hypothetical protein